MKTRPWILGTMLAVMAAPPPVQIHHNPNGQLSLGIGGGSLESKQFDCQGRIVRADPVDVRSTGGRADLLPDSGRYRVTFFGGNLHTRARDPEADDFSGGFGGIQLAREGGTAGIGLGLSHVSGPDGFDFPNVYLRLGPLGGGHLQVELLPPEETFGLSGFARAGIGFRQDGMHRFGGLIGVSFMPYTYSDQMEPRFFEDLHFRVRPNCDLLLGSQIGLGERQTQWLASAGVRLSR